MRRLFAAAVVLTIVATGCSDDGDPEGVESTVPTSGPIPTVATAPPPPSTVVDFFFEAGAIGDDEQLVDTTGDSFAVATSNSLATEVGMDVLAEGGSAVDAAVAIQAMLGLVEPQSSGIGGGAFMLHYDTETQRVTAYDGREEAPAGAAPGMFLGGGGSPLTAVEASGSGDAVGTPGVIAMLALAHEDHGDLAWSSAFDPAIVLARRGIEVSSRMADAIALAALLGVSDDFEVLYSGDDGDPLVEGENFVNPAYADTLTAVADDWRALYEGEVAAEIVAAAGAGPRGGSLSTSDLGDYEARRLDALCRPYREWTLCGGPPSTSGGIGVLSLMGQLEEVGIAPLGPSAAGWHLFIEASQRAYADRDHYVADDRLVSVPVEELLDDTYLALRAASIDPSTATAEVAAGVIDGFERGADSTVEATGASHFVVVDSDGDVVSMTSGVEATFGSRRVAAGFVLNNQLTEFAFTPTAGGRPVANAVAPGKRPRSSMSPTFVIDVGGDVRFALGSAGGASTIASVAKTITGVLDWGMDADQAIALPNVVGRSGTVTVEVPAASTSLLGSLEALGHTVFPTASGASGIHVVEIGTDGSITGAADRRGEGSFETADR